MQYFKTITISSITLNLLWAFQGSVAADGAPVTPAANSLGGFANNVGVQTGYILFNPFTITPIQSSGGPTRYKFQNGSAQSSGFVEAIYKNRYAWRWDPNDTATVAKGYWLGQKDPYTGETYPLDLELRGGFTFGGNNNQSSPTIGTGEGYGSISLGLDVYRAFTGNERLTITTFGPEIFAHINSDRQFSLIHPTAGIGAAFAAGIPIGQGKDSTGRAEILARVGPVYTDVPRLGGLGPEVVGGTTNFVTLVNTDGNGIPIFQMKPAIQSTVEARFSLNKQAFVGFGGSYSKLFDHGPDTWEMYASMTISFETLANLFKVPFTAFDKNASD